MQKINRGDVYFYNFNRDKFSRLERKTRPCVIVSSSEGLKYSEICIVAPVTSRPRTKCTKFQSWYINLKGEDQVILLEQCICVNQKDLTSYQGHLNELEIRKMDEALHICFGLEPNREDIEINNILEQLNYSIDELFNQKLSKALDSIKIPEIKAPEIDLDYSGINAEIGKIKDCIDPIKQMLTSNNQNTSLMIDKLIELFTELKNQQNNDSTSTDENDVIQVDKKSEIKNNTSQTITPEPIIEKPANDEKPKKLDTPITDEVNENIDPELQNVDFSQRMSWNNKLAEFYISEYDKLKISGMMTKYNLTENAVKNKRTSAIQHLSKNGWQTTSNHKTKYTEEYCLEFMKNYREKSFEQLSVIYGADKKALQAKKYSITKWLTNHNVSFKDIDKRSGVIYYINNDKDKENN